MKYLLSVLLTLVTACAVAAEHDLVIRNGTLYDGSGGPPVTGDIAIDGDTILTCTVLPPSLGAGQVGVVAHAGRGVLQPGQAHRAPELDVVDDQLLQASPLIRTHQALRADAVST